MDWQQRYEQDDMPWDKGEAAPALALLIDEWPELFGEGRKILVPGCGLGHDARVIAVSGAEVVGGDIAPLAIERALALGDGGVKFEVMDLFELAEGYRESFDMVWEHTCFCAISPIQRRQYVESLWAALKPGGCLLGVFFTSPESDDGPPYIATCETIEECFAGRFELEHQREPTACFAGREGRETVMLFRRLD